MKKHLLIASLAAFSLVAVAPMFANADTANNSTSYHQKATVQGVVNINTASAAQLATLKRIGAKKAAAIVAYREANGPFKSVDDLTKVKGISQNIVNANKANLSVS